VTNAHDVLYQGARPIVEDVKYAFRKYSTYHNLSFSDDESLLHWGVTDEYIYVDDPARLDGEVVQVGNLGYASFQGQIPGVVGTAAQLSDPTVAMYGTRVPQSSDIEIPVFAS